MEKEQLLNNAAEFIKPLEGFNPKAFWDYAQWTNGFGTKSVKDEVIDEDKATERLINELGSKYDQLVKFNFWKNLNDNQKISLISLVFNAGIGVVIKGTSMYNALSKKTIDIAEVKTAFLSICKAGGKVLQGLIIRREKEFNNFIN